MAEKYEWPGDECPPDCIYAMKLATTSQGWCHRHCGYILKTDQSRGCEPGKNCTRYDNGSNGGALVKSVGPAWNVALGRELWQQGVPQRKIAEQLGTSTASVERRVRLYWKHGRD